MRLHISFFCCTFAPDFFTETTMKRIFRYFGALLVASIPFLAALGDEIAHDFNEMNATPRTINFGPGNTSATTTTDDITYTCGGTATAKFNTDHVYTSKISINLLSNTDYVIVSSPSEPIASVRISYYPASTVYTNLKIYASSDGSDYGSPLSALYESSVINAEIPIGSHYLKIRNEGRTKISIIKMEYTRQTCNCFRYVPE